MSCINIHPRQTVLKGFLKVVLRLHGEEKIMVKIKDKKKEKKRFREILLTIAPSFQKPAGRLSKLSPIITNVKILNLFK